MATACLCGDLGDEEIGAVPVVAEEAKEDQASEPRRRPPRPRNAPAQVGAVMDSMMLEPVAPVPRPVKMAAPIPTGDVGPRPRPRRGRGLTRELRAARRRG